MIGLNHYRNGVVRVTHMPTGIYAQCESDRSQHRNRASALANLRARLYADSHIERVEVVVRHYDLPDGAIVIPDSTLDEIGGGNGK
jgi:protein subunit release factor A